MDFDKYKNRLKYPKRRPRKCGHDVKAQYIEDNDSHNYLMKLYNQESKKLFLMFKMMLYQK